jgi:hypothetical protein
MLDLAAAREWLREHLPPEEPIHVDDAAVLDRAAVLVAVDGTDRQSL